MPIERDPRITPRRDDRLLDNDSNTWTVRRVDEDGVVIVIDANNEERLYVPGAWQAQTEGWQVLHNREAYLAAMIRVLANMEARKVARVAAETLAAERTGDDDYADSLTDAAVRVAHVACDVLDNLDPVDSGDTYTLLGEDVEPLRNAIRGWQAAGEAFLRSLRKPATWPVSDEDMRASGNRELPGVDIVTRPDGTRVATLRPVDALDEAAYAVLDSVDLAEDGRFLVPAIHIAALRKARETRKT